MPRSSTGYCYPGNFADFALSGCEDVVGGGIGCPAISPPVISAAVPRGSISTLEFVFSFVIKAACTCNIVVTSFCILLSRSSIVSIRFQIRRLLFHIRIAATTNAATANVTAVKRQSALPQFPITCFPHPLRPRLRRPRHGIASWGGGWVRQSCRDPVKDVLLGRFHLGDLGGEFVDALP